MSWSTGTKSFFGLLASVVLSVFSKKQSKPTVGDLKQADFTTSTQRLGFRFSERIRDVFRFKWLRKL